MSSIAILSSLYLTNFANNHII